MFIKSHYQRIKGFYFKHERSLMPAMLVVGFLVDYFTFANVEINITFALMFLYWVLAGLAIIFIHLYDASSFAKATADKAKTLQTLKYIRLFSPLAVQFAFGALLGTSLVFYWFSGAFSVSWPLLAITVLLMIFNETFRQYFTKPLAQISVYFFCTISLFSLALPFLFNSLSVWLFVAATIVSLILFFLFLHCISFFASHMRQQKRRLFTSIFSIALAINLLYFTNIIPPIPLALREAGLYHSIQSSNGSYVMRGEYENFFQTSVFGQTLHIQPGSRVYLYTAIFAPARLQTTIVHHWQYYDPQKKEWVGKGKLPFKISGGRKGGYKGYSWESDLVAGRWRVSVENLRGQVLARVRFTAKIADTPVQLQKILR